MPHTCVHCSKIYPDAAPEILSGCTCGSRFFFYLNEQKLQKIKETQGVEVELTPKEKEQIEQDVRDIVGVEEEDAPIVLDFESVKILKPGKYLIDIAKLFRGENPLVYKLEDGKYILDIVADKRTKSE